MRGRVVLLGWFLLFGASLLTFLFCECQSNNSKMARIPTVIEWIFVKGGTFQMGDTFGDGEEIERPVHTVIVNDFYLSKYEVTVGQYRAFCEATFQSEPEVPPWGAQLWGWEADRPIVNVSWNDVESFCQWAECRLPTEAEWEFAARGGSQSSGYKYSGSNNIDEVAWYESNSNSQTHAVGTKKSNELGLYDMSGNVFEWCSDWWGNYSNSPSSNPQGPSSGKFRILRGGSWSVVPRYTRCLNRARASYPGYRFSNVGFRVARTP